ncbi:MAG: hypothetical protein PHH91_01100 [Desulfuromonadaceae bacterium]|nr:hypothetical protein [Desulfuromonadaceae bacterium]
MDVNSITGDAAAYTLPSLSAAVPPGRSTTVASAANNPPSSQTEPPNVVVKADNKIFPANKQAPDAGIEKLNTPVRAMSHVVESYNQQGKVRIKFMDSSNNVVYQIPTEMVAKMEDQMLKPETAADVEG